VVVNREPYHLVLTDDTRKYTAACARPCLLIVWLPTRLYRMVWPRSIGGKVGPERNR